MDQGEAPDVLRRMQGQRRSHDAGDFFVTQLESDSSFRVGRITTLHPQTPGSRFPGDFMIYVYEPPFAEPPAAPVSLSPDQLLIPPFFTLGWMWTKGYFRTFASAPLVPSDLLPQHCFFTSKYTWYVDEYDQLLRDRVEPCGSYSLPNIGFLEKQIAAALDGHPIAAPRGEQYPERRS